MPENSRRRRASTGAGQVWRLRPPNTSRLFAEEVVVQLCTKWLSCGKPDTLEVGSIPPLHSNKTVNNAMRTWFSKWKFGFLDCSTSAEHLKLDSAKHDLLMRHCSVAAASDTPARYFLVRRTATTTRVIVPVQSMIPLVGQVMWQDFVSRNERPYPQETIVRSLNTHLG